MVPAIRSVVGDESELTATEDRLLHSLADDVNQQTPKPEVGLLIGKIQPDLDRASIYTLVPTPPTDAGLPACTFADENVNTKSKNKKKNPNRTTAAAAASTSAHPTLLVVDTEWLAEHARQVSRMLLGGMDVLGIYLWAPEPSLKASVPILSQSIIAVAHAAKTVNHHERLLLHITCSPRRWTCRISSTNSTSDLRPCDFKMGKLLPSLQCFTCTYNFQMRLPIFHESPNLEAFKDAIQIGINCLAKELKSAKALVDDNLVTKDMHCTLEGPREIEILLPFMKESSELCTPTKVLGIVLFSGAVHALTYLGSRASISQAISDIKNDIITSLQSRLDIICEDTDGDEILPALDFDSSNGISVQKSDNQLINHKARYPCNLVFPRRVVIPLLENIFICDYLKQSETYEDVKDHCKEIMSREISAESKILDTEKEARVIMGNSFWGSAVGISTPATDPSTKKLESNFRYRPVHFSLSIVVVTVIIFILSMFKCLLNYTLAE